MSKTEEIKVIISADAGELSREMTVSEKAILRAKGIFRSASGEIEGSSKAWKSYRTAAVGEMERALSGVKKAQAQMDAIKAKMHKQTQSALGPQDEESYIRAALKMGRSDSDIDTMLADMRKTAGGGDTGKFSAEYEQAAQNLNGFQKAAQQAVQQVDFLTDKVNESTQAEEQHRQITASTTQRAKEQAKAALGTTKAHAASAKSSGASRHGLAKFGLTAAMALVGVRSLYAGLRKLATNMLEAARSDRQLSASLGQIKGNMGIAFQSIYQAALPALMALASVLATVTNAIAQLFSALGGASWATASKGADKYAKSASGAGGAAKEAASNMMSLDELNVMNQESGGGGGGGISAILGDPTDIGKWLDVIQSIKVAWQEAWNNKGTELLNEWKRLTISLKKSVNDICDVWLHAWNNGTGKVYFESIITLAADLLGIFGDISVAFNGAWNDGGAGAALIQSFYEKWSHIHQLIETVAESFRNAFNNGSGQEIIQTILQLLLTFGVTMAASLQQIRSTNGLEIWALRQLT
ncbi:MAG: hypothetical protein RR224_03380 [Clostridia bacterium]